VDYLAELFKFFNLSAVGIYGKMDQTCRNDLLYKFRNKQAKILIVTDLAARGLDIPFVENVISLDFPQLSKMFIHRCGRTARAGKDGKAYCLFGVGEMHYLSDLKK
jgi:ATP-dependent RNA helicase DDX54/DBP10